MSHDSNASVVKPWGNYLVLADGPAHKVKTITVKAGQRLSLQRHQHRAETWICVSGTVVVHLGRTLNEIQNIFLSYGESIKIPRGYIHRAAAVAEDAVFIEIQTGTYFGEDDIERFQDDYGR